MSGSITKQKLIAGLITAALATGAVGSAVYAGSLFGLGGSEEKAEEVKEEAKPEEEKTEA